MPTISGKALAAFTGGIDSIRMRYWRLRLRHLGSGSRIYRLTAIYSPRNVSIGDNVSINDFVHIRGAGSVTIGNDVLIAPGVIITSQSHDARAYAVGKLYRETNTSSSVVIEDNVWIGSNAVILPGVTVGRNSIVAAGAVVIRNVEELTVVGGVPAVRISHISGGD